MESLIEEIDYNYIGGEGRAPKSPHKMTGRRYPFIVAVFVIEGSYHCSIENVEYIARKNETLIVPEYINHDIWMDGKGILSWAHISARLANSDVLSYFNVPYIMNGRNSFAVKSAAERLALLKTDSANVFNEIAAKVRYDYNISLIISSILDNSRMNGAIDPKRLRWKKDVVSYIQDNISSKITLECLALKFNVSTSKLSKNFIEVFGVPPIKYIREYKCRAAAQMLLSGKTISQISDSLGFYDEYHFSKQFKNILKYSPKNYRKNYLAAKC